MEHISKKLFLNSRKIIKKRENDKVKGEKEYKIQFIEGEHTYTISFDAKKKIFHLFARISNGK